MTDAARKIQQAMRELPLDDMLALHEHLVLSIHEREASDRLDPNFRNEILKRIDQIESGNVKGTDAFEALKGM
jgi:hypothetical protein